MSPHIHIRDVELRQNVSIKLCVPRGGGILCVLEAQVSKSPRVLVVTLTPSESRPCIRRLFLQISPTIHATV